MQTEMSMVNEKIEVAKEYIASIATDGYNDQVDNAHHILSLARSEDWAAIQEAELFY